MMQFSSKTLDSWIQTMMEDCRNMSSEGCPIYVGFDHLLLLLFFINLSRWTHDDHQECQKCRQNQNENYRVKWHAVSSISSPAAMLAKLALPMLMGFFHFTSGKSVSTKIRRELTMQMQHNAYSSSCWQLRRQLQQTHPFQLNNRNKMDQKIQAINIANQENEQVIAKLNDNGWFSVTIITRQGKK